MKKVLIGFGAKAQIGKDYAVIKLKENYNYDIERIAFADELKKDLGLLFSVNNLNLQALLSSAETKKVVRPLLVEYGQVLRHFNPDVWVDRALKDRKFEHEVTIVTDVRFPNEVVRLKAMGGTYVHIDADVLPANEVEAKYDPQMRDLADFIVRNDFDPEYIDRMAALITDLRMT